MISVKDMCNCVELPFSGSKFTWKKKGSGGNNILEQIGKCLVSIEWLHKFPSAKVHHSIFTTSDH